MVKGRSPIHPIDPDGKQGSGSTDNLTQTSHEMSESNAKDSADQSFWSHSNSSVSRTPNSIKDETEGNREHEEKEKEVLDFDGYPTTCDSNAGYTKSNTFEKAFTKAVNEVASSAALERVYWIAQPDFSVNISKSDFSIQKGPRYAISECAKKMEDQGGLRNAVESFIESLVIEARRLKLDERRVVELGLSNLTAEEEWDDPNSDNRWVKITSGKEWPWDERQAEPKLADITSRKKHSGFSCFAPKPEILHWIAEGKKLEGSTIESPTSHCS